MDPSTWGGFKASLTCIINLVKLFVNEDIMSDAIDEARTLMQQLNTKYEALENALEGIDSVEYWTCHILDRVD